MSCEYAIILLCNLIVIINGAPSDHDPVFDWTSILSNNKPGHSDDKEDGYKPEFKLPLPHSDEDSYDFRKDLGWPIPPISTKPDKPHSPMSDFDNSEFKLPLPPSILHSDEDSYDFRKDLVWPIPPISTKPEKPHSPMSDFDFKPDFHYPLMPTNPKPNNPKPYEDFLDSIKDFTRPPPPTIKPNKPHLYEPDFDKYPFKPDQEWPTKLTPIKPLLYEPDFADSSNNVEVQHTWNTESRVKNTNTVLIVVPLVIILIIIAILTLILIVLRKSARNNQNRWRRPGDSPPFIPATNNTPSVTVSTSVNSNIVPEAHNLVCNNRSTNVSQPNNPNVDLPPSYDEAVTNFTPSAPPLYK